MKHLTLLTLVVAFLLPVYVQAQDKQDKFDFKFGKASPQDFELPADAVEKDAAAFFICDKGFSEFRGNTKGWFSLVYTRKVRIRVNNANGVDAADFQIPLYRDGSAVEKLTGLKAMSYNLEDGKVVETSLKNDQVFSDKLSKNVELRKFSVPGVKAGSLIDVTYTVESDFMRNLQPWTFQGGYPRYWSEYEVAIPSFFNYVILAQGYHPFHTRSSNDKREAYNVTIPDGSAGGRSYNERLEASVQMNRWVMKNVPALKKEPFTSSLDNHISKIEFQLNQYRFEGQPSKDVMARWPQVVEEFNNAESFGQQLYKNNGWLDDEVGAVVMGAKTPEEKAKKIYCYLRDKYTCTKGGMYLTTNLRAVPKTKSGNVADINLLLVAMLNHEKIETFPVILSTRSNGWTHELYPLIDRFNYVVAQATIDGKQVYLDATEPGLPFGVLPAQCYNGHARVMTGYGEPVYLFADSLTENKTSTVFMHPNEKGEWVAELSSSLGTYESLQLRQEVKENGATSEREKIKKALPSEFTLEADPKLLFVDTADRNVKVEYTMKLNMEEGADVLYLNPMFGEAYKENPFKSAERLYPVEMPYAMNEVFVANIIVPQGYEIDEVPKSARVALFENDGMFEYLVSKDEGKIMLRSKITINKADFPAEDYEVLREFFSYVVKKQAEAIVLKKKGGAQ